MKPQLIKMKQEQRESVYVMTKKAHIIKEIETGSIAEELELEPGDELVSINGAEIKDVLDYHYLIKEEELTVLIKKPDGEEWELDIEKDYEEDLGIIFEEGLMDEYRSCRNKCIFCFIDQMPPGMRETLYFKDDDARLSFLQGNYITLTNLSDEELDRIIFYKLSPINISIHTMNEELRCRMLHNRFAGSSLAKLKKLKAAGITMNGQIVLCKGWNDGEELERTIHDLSAFLPEMESVSIVPVGLTKFREGLERLEPFTGEDSRLVLEQVRRWQGIFLQHYGTRFIYASDEWYLKAELPVPDEDDYEGYPQLENGVGLVRSLQAEFEEAYGELEGDDRARALSIATGVLAAPVLRQLVGKLKQKFPNIDIKLYTILNHYFGTQITVAGLLTGTDIIAQLKAQPLGEYLLLPEVLLRNGEDILLDDVTVADMEKALQTKIRIVQSDGKSFIDSVLM
jgi:putative radical SAM enzyme (TIGR03279 family)